MRLEFRKLKLPFVKQNFTIPGYNLLDHKVSESIDHAASKCEETLRFASLASCYVFGFPTFERQNLDAGNAVEQTLRWWLEWVLTKGYLKWKRAPPRLDQSILLSPRIGAGFCGSYKSLQWKNKLSWVLVTTLEIGASEVAYDQTVRLSLCIHLWRRISDVAVNYCPI